MHDTSYCPHIDRDDNRCRERFTLRGAEAVFSVCCGGQHGCMIFHRLNMESAYGTLDAPRPAIRRATAVPTPLTVSADARRMPIRNIGS